jgi:hypothetical protein
MPAPTDAQTPAHRVGTRLRRSSAAAARSFRRVPCGRLELLRQRREAPCVAFESRQLVSVTRRHRGRTSITCSVGISPSLVQTAAGQRFSAMSFGVDVNS